MMVNLEKAVGSRLLSQAIEISCTIILRQTDVSRFIRRLCRQFLTILVLLLVANQVGAGQLDDFSSDGCSQFPDGTFTEPDLWCDCCIIHDLAYWQGGNRQQKKQADRKLQDCVLTKTNNKTLADTMYLGVTVGGSPVFPTGYRWGYGWRYGRGFQRLNGYEKQLVQEKIKKYQQSTPKQVCEFDHPISVKVKQQWRKLVEGFE